MEVLIWIGSAVSAVGLAGLIWCIALASRAKRANLPDDALRARLQGIVALNLGALLLSSLGLMMVIAGIFLS